MTKTATATSSPPAADPGALPDTLCYINGEYTPLKDAKISVMDRGFIFGDGVYEVVPAYGGRLFRFNEHMARLERSLLELRIESPMTRDEWKTIATKLMEDAAGQMGTKVTAGNQIIYIQVSRGVAMREHHMVAGIKPTVFMMCNPMKLPNAQQREKGVACVTADDFRWEKAHIKSTSLLGAVFARQISADADASETVMFRGDYLSEASSSNVWVVKNGKVSGPPKDKLVLEGIRYGLMEEMCRAAGVEFELRRITRQEVWEADELLLTSATKEVLPITSLDGKPVGNGHPGPIYNTLYGEYQQEKQEQKNRG